MMGSRAGRNGFQLPCCLVLGTLLSSPGSLEPKFPELQFTIDRLAWHTPRAWLTSSSAAHLGFMHPCEAHTECRMTNFPWWKSTHSRSNLFTALGNGFHRLSLCVESVHGCLVCHPLLADCHPPVLNRQCLPYSLSLTQIIPYIFSSFLQCHLPRPHQATKLVLVGVEGNVSCGWQGERTL